MPATPSDFLDGEGISGNLHEGFTANLLGRFASAFALLAREEIDLDGRYLMVAAACDGRPIMQRHFAAAIEKLMWAGCHVMELGTVPRPALSWCLGQPLADCGIYLGNPYGDPHKAAMRFFGRHAQPLTAASLKALGRSVETGPHRPVRVAGKASKGDALDRYMARFAHSFHGLRPLRFLLHTNCRPVGGSLHRLLRNTACKMVLRESESHLPAGFLDEMVGHFAVAIEDDGCRCRLWDESGQPVSFERFCKLVAHILSARHPRQQSAVVDKSLPVSLNSSLRRTGWNVIPCGSAPSDLAATMRVRKASLGADAAGRVWFGQDDEPVLPDALAALTLLLGKLSQADRPLSRVLDEDVPDH